MSFSYKDFIYFIYNLGIDYYDGLDIISDEDWHDILEALKENYVQYEVEKKIKYKEFRENMASFLNTKFYKHKHAYEVMTDAMTSFGQGNDTAKLKYLIKDFEEHEKFKQECADNENNLFDNGKRDIKIYFYSEEKPAEDEMWDYFWHYVDGVPTAW